MQVFALDMSIILFILSTGKNYDWIPGYDAIMVALIYMMHM